MAISEAEVSKVALLARLTLSDEEIKLLTRQLDAILEYVGQLDELDTQAVEPMAHVADVSNVLREDEVGVSLSPETALANAPKRERGLFVVPPVFE